MKVSGEGREVGGRDGNSGDEEVRRGVSNTLGEGREGEDIDIVASLEGEGGGLLSGEIAVSDPLRRGVLVDLRLRDEKVWDRSGFMVGLASLELEAIVEGALTSPLLIEISGEVSVSSLPKLKAAGLWMMVREV